MNKTKKIKDIEVYENDIKQIIPAPLGMYSKYTDEDVYCILPIVCIALKYDGTVVFLEACNDGTIEEILGNETLCDKDGNDFVK